MRKSTLAILVVTLAATVSTGSSLGVAAGKGVKLRELMTPAEFNRTGLTKLTAAELGALEEWLGVYTEAVAQVLRMTETKRQALPSAPSPRGPAASREVIETCIEDEFEGWEGETIFKLCNGQIWQQSEYGYMYHHSCPNYVRLRRILDSIRHSPQWNWLIEPGRNGLRMALSGVLSDPRWGPPAGPTTWTAP